jgi:MFS family permease
LVEKHNVETFAVSRSAWITLIILSSTLLTVFFSETMLLPAIPDIMTDFNIPYGTAAWIFSGYMIVAAVMTPIAGRMSDIHGKKKVLLTLLVIYIVGTIIGGFANSISILLVSRIIQGVGLAAIPAAFSLVRDSFPPAKIAIAIGVFGSAYSAGSVIGLLAGARIIENSGWHSTFFYIAPVAVLVTFMIAKFVKENKDQVQVPTQNTQPKDVSSKMPSSPLDIKGALALSATITAFLIALTLVQIGVNSENIVQIAVAFAISSISLFVFVIIEKKTLSPLLDLRLLKDKVLLPSYIIMMVQGVTMFLAYPTIVQLVRSPVPLGFGGTAVDAANVQLPFMVMFLVFASVTPFIINKMGNIKPIIIGAIITIIGSIGLLVFHSTELEISINLTILAAGLSLANLSAWNVVVTSSPKEFMGISTGVGALLLFIGMSIGPALAGVYMTHHQTIQGIHGSYPSLASYDMVFFTSILFSAACLGFSLMLHKKLVSSKHHQES